MLGMGEAVKASTQTPAQSVGQPNAQSADIEGDKKTFVGIGMQMLYDKKFIPQAEKLLADGQNTIEDMAQIGSNIAMGAFKKAMEAGKDLDPMVMLEGGEQLMQEVAEFARASGADVSDEDVETAFISAADKFRQKAISQGMVTEEELAAESQKLGEVAKNPEIQQRASRVHQNRQGGAPAAAPADNPMKGMG